jgi:hypothetical protein
VSSGKYLTEENEVERSVFVKLYDVRLVFTMLLLNAGKYLPVDLNNETAVAQERAPAPNHKMLMSL